MLKSDADMECITTDHLEAEAYGPLSDRPLVWIDAILPGAAAQARQLRCHSRAIIAGVDRSGACPSVDFSVFDLLLTTAVAPAAPWTAVSSSRLDDRMRTIQRKVLQAPLAAGIAVDVIRTSAHLPFDLALAVESLGYSTALAGAEFQRWLRSKSPSAIVEDRTACHHVLIEREDTVVTITLSRPDTRNAMRATMRDALHEALCAVLDDPSRPDVVLRGAGECFSVGGDLAEFGTANDMARAHAIRTLRSCAARLQELGSRARVELHGACIGSGIEIAAAAQRRIAAPGTFFQLPELGMGLIPGAGGTVSISRAIGTHRALYMLLSGRRVGMREASAWGLVEPAA